MRLMLNQKQIFLLNLWTLEIKILKPLREKRFNKGSLKHNQDIAKFKLTTLTNLYDYILNNNLSAKGKHRYRRSISKSVMS